jgi:3-hydroxyisobutyrate dehydrogenase-like beta-hydroxyacid dehydrogenase
MSDQQPIRRITLVGFGEVGTIFGRDLVQQGLEVSTYDILLDAAASRPAMVERAHAAAVVPHDTLAAAVQDADLVISAVTASSARDVARDIVPCLHSGQVFLDVNSVSPETKRGNARLVEASGADYVEAAVMAPVPPQRLAVPMLLGGRRAQQVAAALKALGMNATPVAEEIGTASAIKMCRSIVIKGIEALVVESMFAARRFGAEKAVLASLDKTFPHMGWGAELPDYLVSRVAEHGRRRAAEMREVALTLEEVGIPPIMATATANRHDALVEQMASAGIAYPARGAFSWRAFADALAESPDRAGKRASVPNRTAEDFSQT